MKIRFLVNNVDDAAYYHWRVTKPVEFMQKYAVDADTIIAGNDIPSDTSILVLPKMTVDAANRAEAQQFFKQVRSQGTKIVYDADDDMWSEAFVSYMTKFTYKNGSNKELLTAIMNETINRSLDNLWVLMQCDAVTVSTNLLGEYIRRVTTLPTFVVPNAIDVQGFQRNLDVEKAPKEKGYVTIGWAGGARVQDDLTQMLTAWNILAKSFTNLRFVIAGWLPDLSEYENLNVIHIPWASPRNYGANMQVDIGCVSVENSHFSLCKSLIKAWEFSLAGAAVAGSSNLYSSEPITLCDSTEMWIKTLTVLLRNVEIRETLAETYQKFVKAMYDIEYNWLYWPDAYSKIMNTVGV